MERWLCLVAILGALIQYQVAFGAPAEGENAEVAASHDRVKRQLSIPGTNWCGLVDANQNIGFGPNHKADACCKAHVQCTEIIRPLETKYYYFNLRPYTLTSCDCQERFRQCLRSAGTSVAHTVGETFWNILKVQCFDLVRRRVCVRWFIFWCTKYDYRNTAVISSKLVGTYTARR